jgi:hypothetical protein
MEKTIEFTQHETKSTVATINLKPAAKLYEKAFIKNSSGKIEITLLGHDGSTKTMRIY